MKKISCNIFVYFWHSTRISELITWRSFRRDSFLQVSVGIDTDARCLDKVPSGRCDHLRRTFRGRPPEEPVSSAVLASLHWLDAQQGVVKCQLMETYPVPFSHVAVFDNYIRQPISVSAIDRPLANLRELSRTNVETIHCLRTWSRNYNPSRRPTK